MGFDRIRIKSNARLFYKNNTGTSICALLIYVGVSFGSVIVIDIVAAVLTGVSLASMARPGGMSDIYDTCDLVRDILTLAAEIAILPLAMGLINWYRQSIYRKTSLTEVFAQYTGGRFWGAVGTSLLVALYTWLWSLLFIIPGIIKTYSYSQAMFIKAENPNIPASRAIELSRIMMNGHKWELFVMQFTFIGWMLLSVFTLHILGIVYVFPYYISALTFAYEEIKMDAASRGLINLAEICQPVVENPGL